MGASFKAVLHPTARADGSQQVRIRITVNRVSRFWDQGVTARAKDWNPKAGLDTPKWLRANHPDASLLNTHLVNALRKARELALAHPDWSAEQLRGELVAPAPAPTEPCVVAYLRTFIPLHTASLATRTGLGWWRLYRAVVGYRGGEFWPISEFTPTALRALHHYIKTRPNGGESGATQRLRQLSTVGRALVDDGLLEHHRNPFLKAKFELPAAAPGRVLTLEEQARVLGAVLPDTAHGKAMQIARDVFQTQFLTWGSRVGDVLELTWGQVRGTEIIMRERKTGKTKPVAILDPLQEILDRYKPRSYDPEPHQYVFPLLERYDWRIVHRPGQTDDSTLRAISRATKRLNGYLRRLAALAGVEPFTSHAARHSFAWSADKVLNNIREVQRLLNHSNPRITETYLAQLSNSAVQQAGSRVLQSWNNGTTAEQQSGSS